MVHARRNVLEAEQHRGLHGHKWSQHQALSFDLSVNHECETGKTGGACTCPCRFMLPSERAKLPVRETKVCAHEARQAGGCPRSSLAPRAVLQEAAAECPASRLQGRASKTQRSEGVLTGSSRRGAAQMVRTSSFCSRCSWMALSKLNRSQNSAACSKLGVRQQLYRLSFKIPRGRQSPMLVGKDNTARTEVRAAQRLSDHEKALHRRTTREPQRALVDVQSHIHVASVDPSTCACPEQWQHRRRQ